MEDMEATWIVQSFKLCRDIWYISEYMVYVWMCSLILFFWDFVFIFRIYF